MINEFNSLEARVINIDILRKDLRCKIKENLEADLKDKFLEKPYRRGKYILLPTSKKHILMIQEWQKEIPNWQEDENLKEVYVKII